MVAQRLGEYIDYKDISYYAFENSLGVSRGSISKAVKQNKSIGSSVLENILTVYPDLNPNWLLTGKGEMINGSCAILCNEQASVSRINSKNREGIPLIPADAMAGVLSGNDIQVMSYECTYYTIPEFKDADFLMTIRGDSMTPRFCSGDIVACKLLPMTSIFFQWNKVYVVGSEQGILLKRVKRSVSDQSILLVSENPDYDPFELLISEIYSLAIVIGTIRLE